MNIEYRALRNDGFNTLPALLASCGFERGAAMPDRFRPQPKNESRR